MSVKSSRKIVTLSFIHQPPKLLLGLKKRGFGVGKWNGFGGKVQEGETIEEAAKRELFEETGLVATFLEKSGRLEFEFSGNPEILEVHVFKVNGFSGEMRETDEMKPEWFHVNELPWQAMWPDDEHWLPMLLRGKKFNCRFVYDKHDKLLNYELKEV